MIHARFLILFYLLSVDLWFFVRLKGKQKTTQVKIPSRVNETHFNQKTHTTQNHHNREHHEIHVYQPSSIPRRPARKK